MTESNGNGSSGGDAVVRRMRFRDEGMLYRLPHLRPLIARKSFDGDHKRARGRDLDRAFFGFPLAGAIPAGLDFSHAR